MFMRYLGGGVGHCAERQEDPYNVDDNEDMWIDEDEDANPSTYANMQTDVDADEDLDLDYDDVDHHSVLSDSSGWEEDLGPEDGEDELEDEEADFDGYDAL
jgi:hypothetical protein